MSSWREDASLVRTQAEDDLYQTIELEEDWQRLFDVFEPMFITTSGGTLMEKGQRALFRGFIWQAKKKVSQAPQEARQWVVDAMRVICAALRIEPLELFPDLKKVA